MARRLRSSAVALCALAQVLGPFAPLTGSSAAATTTTTTPEIPAPKAWILVDADTGYVIAAGNEHEALPPASTVKLMTALVAVEEIGADDEVSVSALAAAQPAMRIGMKQGELWRFDDALHSLLMVSANDAAYALAEEASGSLTGFATEMQRTGARYGMVDSTFADPAGLSDAAAFGGGSLMSAYDIAISARNALAMPEIARIALKLEYDFVGPDGIPHTLRNHNDKFLEGYAGATGLKPGYTDLAGRTLVATATREGRTMIAVVLNTYGTKEWAMRLLDQGFATVPGDKGTGVKLPEPAATKAESASLRAIEAAESKARDERTVVASSDRESSSASSRLFTATNFALGAGALICIGFVRRRRVIRARKRRRLERRRARELAASG